MQTQYNPIKQNKNPRVHCITTQNAGRSPYLLEKRGAACTPPFQLLSSSRENRVGHSVFFLYLDLCLPTKKIATPAAGLACGGLRLRRAYTLRHKVYAVQGTGFFSPFSFSFSLLLFLYLPFSSPSLTPSARSALLAFPNICFGPHS